ncbi:hypothetical protein SAMN05216370_2816 [Pseudomonas peli]|jgi:hypothetical protein|uniref:DUF2059 domain-containing protein n=1 Tax=Pseudomonas peli TaxID=592361 RepID=A0AB37Z9G6_9PSED|nr:MULTISPECIES: DUF2059 domain-containing protein [Pseudomonas]MDR7024444.1 hypothetical protein [Pseudomonas peli]NMY50669.1 DUF2059 domain-containing protein [Pseudomonas sp. WS 5011]NMZ70398.1 DUF2059 domain-containing protein [Pseudomonas peli]PJE40357.1 MAG: DUF2059 domain-containing protein [Pseudomonas sp.] [Pseudomonas sp. FEMGT703P]SCW68753.1 hypothetical protein SAMN05216370_2816 [Pseudomonas peli]
MSRLPAFCAALILTCGSAQVLADAKSHAADAERFLLLARADKLAVPVYAQVQQMFAQRFAESNAPQSEKAVLETYQAQANAALEQAVGWDKLKPDMVKLYTSNFNEQEMKDLIRFYESPLGKKVLEKMPTLTAQSAQLTQGKLEAAVPKVNQLLAEMTTKLTPKKP